MLGPIALAADPISAMQAATKQYTDALIAASGVSSFNTRTGAVALTSGDVTTALTYTPYDVANPAGYQTAAQVATTPRTGTTTNDNAAAGQIGEFISSNVPAGSAVPLTSTSPANVTAISLTAGDWDVNGNVRESIAGGTTGTYLVGVISLATASLTEVTGGYSMTGQSALGTPAAVAVGPVRVSVAATTTVYLNAQAMFAGGTMAAYGYIRARRVR